MAIQIGGIGQNNIIDNLRGNTAIGAQTGSNPTQAAAATEIQSAQSSGSSAQPSGNAQSQAANNLISRPKGSWSKRTQTDDDAGDTPAEPQEEIVEATPESSGLELRQTNIPGGSTTRMDPVPTYIDVTTGEPKQPLVSELIGKGIQAGADAVQTAGENVKLAGRIAFIDENTGKVRTEPRGLIASAQAYNEAGVSYAEQAEAFGTVVGIAALPLGVGALGSKAVGAAGAKIIPKVTQEIIPKGLAAANTGAAVGGFAGVGGETRVSQATSEASQNLKDISRNLRQTARTPAEIVGANVAAFGLGVAGGSLDLVGAGASALKGIGQTAQNVLNLGVGKAGDIYLSGLGAAGRGLIQWAGEAPKDAAYSLGEVAGFGGSFKVGKAVINSPQAIKTGVIRGAQGDIVGSFADLAGLPGADAKKAFGAAGKAVDTAMKVNVPLKDPNSVQLKELTMFEDIDAQTLRQNEKALADAGVVSYGTTSNVLYGLDFRRTSDFDASVPWTNAKTLQTELVDINKGYGARASKPFNELSDSIQIERPAPGSGAFAHMYDLHRLEEGDGTVSYSTSTRLRTPTQVDQYNRIKILGARNNILVEPLEYAYSRKYAATYFPATDRLANLKETSVRIPARIEYQTKIDLDSYKTGMVKDLDTPQLRSIPVKGAAYQTARFFGTLGNISAKAKTADRSALGTISRKVNYPVELGDSHRMKDALDLVGITWEYSTKLVDKNVRNPVRRELYKRTLNKSLDRMLKDQYLRAQIKTGAAGKLSELSPAFGNFLYQSGILTERQYRTTQRPASTTSAFRSGTPNIERFRDISSPKTAATSKASPSPVSFASPFGSGKTRTAQASFPADLPSYFKDSYPTAQKRQLRVSYPVSSPAPGRQSVSYPSITMGRTGSPRSPIPYSPYSRSFLEEYKPLQKKNKDEKDRKSATYNRIRIGTRRHLGIADPLEFLGEGSITKRSKRSTPERVRLQDELSWKKRPVYEFDGGYSGRKPKNRTRRR